MSRVQDLAMELAKDICERSTVKIQVGAVLFNKKGIIAWGWNNLGNGLGEHAEAMAVLRGRRKNILNGASIAVYSLRRGVPITSRPCRNCESLLRSYGIQGTVYTVKLMRNYKPFFTRIEEDWGLN